MYKLLLVDDEELTCETIMNFIPWQVHQIKQVKTATNGIEALKIYDDFKPDIIVCDIRMPKMNGITLIKKLREKDGDFKVIFISGFADKDYLKSAINLKASGFVEKPLMSNDVLEAVKAAVTELNDRNEELNATYKDNRSFIKSKVVNNLISKTEDFTKHQDALGKIGCKLLIDKSAIVIITNLTFISMVPIEQKNRIINDIIEGINNADTDCSNLAAKHKDNSIVAIVSIADGSTEMSTARSFYNRIIDICPVKINPDIAYGSIDNSYEDIKESYKKAAIAANNRFYRKSGAIGGDYEYGYTYEPGINMYRKYRDKLNTNKLEEIYGFYDEFLSDVLEYRDQNINYIKNTIFNLMTILLDHVMKNGIDKIFEQSDKPYIWLKIQESSNIYDLVDFIKTLTDSYLTKVLKTGTNTKIQMIKDYVKSNHGDNTLTMDEIALHLNYSTNYISNLFKKETGITLIEYTTRIRIESAKKLITTTDKKLYEIANQSGFYDANYFSTVFKKIVGISPSKYKDKISNV
jgi:two-component system response regulator YesN